MDGGVTKDRSDAAVRLSRKAINRLSKLGNLYVPIPFAFTG